MSTSDWITLGAAILVGGGTLFLGIMAWRTIHQTRSIQKAEKRERLLNEIIEWAIDIAKCGKEIDLSTLLQIPDDKKNIFVPLKMKEMAISLGAMEGRNQYISTIALTFGEDLREAIDILLDSLEEYKELLSTKSEDITDMSEIVEKLDSHDRQLLTATNNVIEETVKIKTRDIS
ncbi:hypothetical protein ES707_09793 [subsurface metagenome]|jgi:hypothetical protein